MNKVSRKNEAIAELFMLLRHRPDNLRYTHDGWFDLEEVLSKLEDYQIDKAKFIEGIKSIDRLELLSSRIRAVHGHSIDVKIEYPEKIPPALLYHGTPIENKALILEKGLTAKRHHVFLTDNIDVARDVVHRYDKKSVIFGINSEKMSYDGIKFYVSNNDVWLTKHVDPSYLRVIEIDE